MRSARMLFYAAGVLALPGLAGCGGGSGTTPTTPPPLLPASVSAAVPDGLTATLAEDRTGVAVGGTVTYTLTLANNTALPITYRPVIGGAGPSGFPASLLVTDAQGNTAFPLGAMTAVIFIGPSATIAPGQSVSGTVAVGDNKNLGQFPAAGRYSAVARFTVQTGQDSASETATAVGPLAVDAQ